MNQRRRLATFGRADVLSLDHARKKAIIYLGKVASNEDPQSERKALQNQKTVRDLYVAFLENHLKKKRVQWKCDDSTLRRRILPKLGSRLANSITSADIEAIHSEVGAQHPYAANDILEIVRKMFN